MQPPKRRFLGTAPYYATYRVPYPPALIGLVAEFCGLRPQARLLDLGCGPGQLALAFAPLCGRVVGIDPEQTMLEEARKAAVAAGQNIEFRLGSAPQDLTPDLAPLRLVTIGRAFHWMDRPAVLAALDALVEPGGAIAFFSDRHPRTAENAWIDTFETLRREHGRDDPIHKARADESWRSHESVLLDSPFSDLTGLSHVWRRSLTLDEVVGRVYSMSGTSPAALGGRREAFESLLRRQVAKTAGGETLTEVVEAVALVARRPDR